MALRILVKNGSDIGLLSEGEIWTNIDLWSVRSSSIHLRKISPEIFKISVNEMKFTDWK